jgi:hypothetical protein
MLYTVADVNWSPGRPLPPLGARAGFHRMRASAVSIAGGRPVLAAAIWYDSLRGRVVAHGTRLGGRGGSWAAPATMNALGAVTVLAPIPAGLVREIGPAEIRSHSGHLSVFPRSHVRAPCLPDADPGSDSGALNETGRPNTLLPPECSTRRPRALRRGAPMVRRVVSSGGAKARRAGARVLAVLTRGTA